MCHSINFSFFYTAWVVAAAAAEHVGCRYFVFRGTSAVAGHAMVITLHTGNNNEITLGQGRCTHRHTHGHDRCTHQSLMVTHMGKAGAPTSHSWSHTQSLRRTHTVTHAVTHTVWVSPLYPPHMFTRTAKHVCTHRRRHDCPPPTPTHTHKHAYCVLPGGGSLKMWQAYFGGSSNVALYGLDLNEYTYHLFHHPPEVTLFLGRQENRTFLREVCVGGGGRGRATSVCVHTGLCRVLCV